MERTNDGLGIIRMKKKEIEVEPLGETLTLLNCRGYYATFATGFDEAKNLIEQYLNKKMRG